MHIDWWTLALQTINVLILIWILARFFFRPVMDIVAKRQQAAAGLLADAERARQLAADARAEADKEQAKLAAQREGLIADARNAAQLEKRNLLEHASQEIAKLHSEAESALAHDRAAAESAIIDRASELSIDIAQRLLSRVPQQDLLNAFVDDICREVRALSPAARASLVSAAGGGHPIEVVTAARLSDQETQHVCGVLEKAFGADVRFAFRSDPAIIAGVELKSRNEIIRSSWRADLDQIRQELTGDKSAGRS